MVSAHKLLHLIDTGREVRRLPLVGMHFLHQPRLATRESLAPRRANLIVDRFAGSQPQIPRICVALRVFTPSGKPAVRMRLR
jgi:hypothetical protein